LNIWEIHRGYLVFKKSFLTASALALPV